MSDYNASLVNIQGSVEAVDYPTAMTDLQQESVSQQATLNVMSKVKGRSLFDYLA